MIEFLIRKYPNDYDLGYEVRKKYFDLVKHIPNDYDLGTFIRNESFIIE
jgi:hypothetical protein